MCNRRLSFLISTAFVWVSATTLADNTITISGGGGSSKIDINASATSNSSINIYQVGTVGGAANEIKIVQSGGSQTLFLGQGASYSGGSWAPGTPVAGDKVDITQSGLALQATIIQNNDSGVNTVIATQTGTGILNVTQGGSGGNSAEISTSSSGNLTVNQTGSGNTAIVSNMIGGTAAITQSSSSGYVKLENQSAGGLTVDQRGPNSALLIANYGSGANFSITQYGYGGGEGKETHTPSGELPSGVSLTPIPNPGL